MFISIARYLGIKKPFCHRAKDKYTVLYHILLTWFLGMFVASPIPILALVDVHNVMPAGGVCQINNTYFVIIGSVVSFYLPLVTIITMYCLTVTQLKKPTTNVLAGKRHIRIPSVIEKAITSLPKKQSEDSGSHPTHVAATQHTRK